MSSKGRDQGLGPWPPTQWHAERLRSAGGTDSDVEALRWAPPGTARRNVFYTLLAHRRHPQAVPVICKLVKTGGCYSESAALIGHASAALPELELPTRIWRGLIVLAGLLDPEVARHLRGRRGSVAKWTQAFERSGWVAGAKAERVEWPFESAAGAGHFWSFRAEIESGRPGQRGLAIIANSSLGTEVARWLGCFDIPWKEAVASFREGGEVVRLPFEEFCCLRAPGCMWSTWTSVKRKNMQRG